MRAVAAGVHHALRDPFVVEVEDFLPEVEVLQRVRAALADPQCVLVVGDRHALLRGQHRPAVPGHLVRLAAPAAHDLLLAIGHRLPGVIPVAVRHLPVPPCPLTVTK